MSSNSHSNTPTARPAKPHLDSEYRDRYELYTTPGKRYNSRTTNWHEVPWGKVTKLQAKIKGKKYTVDKSGPSFKSFIRWRWGGVDKGKQINIWCIGWTDGVTCFMKEIQFKDGSMTEKEYPFEQFKKHLPEDLR